MSKRSGPGIVLGFFQIRDSSKASQHTLESCFDQELVPKLLETEGVTGAWLYKAANPAYNKQQILVYKLSDLASIQAKDLQRLAKTSKHSHLNGSVDDHVEFDSRSYSFVQLYEISEHSEDAAPTIMLAMMEPSQGGETDLDAWYHDEHNQQMSEQPGWWRTTRFSLRDQHSNRQEGDKLSFLAIHEFGDDNQLGTEVKALEPMSDWTKKVMSEAKAIDAAIYHKEKEFGNATTTW
ncbi:hypothetical protein CC86DRAFT_415536 [Ophiobolus disseminans]|uniref:ABM domain-containing protein n=1 Tax=Ophiobolus disseminans TaxID=1469910 RepID=A0A6A7AK65_9PLEO|nr:hypothetical protein CC86DRAFT_415536 [Ophiobolus disseminans]